MRNWMIGLMLAISTPALADHGAQPTGPNAAAIQHSFRVTSTLAAYDVDGERGEWSALVAQGEYAATDWMSVVASVPTVRITSDWGDSSSGIGDMSLGLKSTIPSWEIQDFRWVVALYGTAPTGSEEKRIGAGHFELAPVLEMAFALRQQWTISTTAGTKVSLGGHQGHEHEEDGSGAVIPHDHPGSLYSPHAETELESRIALTKLFDGGLGELGIKGGWALGHDSHLTPAEIELLGGVFLGHGWTLLAGLGHTVTEEVRAPWKLHLGIAWTGGGESASQPHSHSHAH